MLEKQQLKTDTKLVSLAKQLNYNSHTALELYRKIQVKNSFLFHSPKNENSLSRYSFLGYGPFLVFESKGKTVSINGKKKKSNPFEELRKLLHRYKTEKSKSLPPFYGGVVGYFGYDLVNFIEKLPKKAKDDLNLPDSKLLFIDKTFVFDHLNKKLYAISLAESSEKAKEKIKQMQSLIDKKISMEDIFAESHNPFASIPEPSEIKSNFTKSKYLSAIKKIKKYIKLGDTFQVNLSQRFEVTLNEDPLTIFQRLTEINPSPFSGFIDFGDFQIISCSPERLIKVENGLAETRPIGGTHPRGKDKQEDLEIEQQLLSNKKELAEHTMLVDLERNDLGKVSEFGSVKPVELFTIERYSHVMHLVSNIKSKLRKNVDLIDVIQAMFPGGTITGCPKPRTMEIIEDLEPTKRGPYTGSLGYLTFSGNMDLNILIRSFVCKGNKYYFQAGGGIVQDSDQEKEYEETFHKAKALIESINYGNR